MLPRLVGRGLGLRVCRFFFSDGAGGGVGTFGILVFCFLGVFLAFSGV